MTKKSNSFKNITTVLLALLLIGIAAGPASAALNTTNFGAGTIVVAGLNSQVALGTANGTTVLFIGGTDSAGDVAISTTAITISVPSGTGLTFNTSFTPSVGGNKSAGITFGSATFTGNRQINVPTTTVGTGGGWNLTISNVYVDVAGTTSAGNIPITVHTGQPSVPDMSNAVLTVAKPTVSVNGTVTLPFGAGNATGNTTANSIGNITIITTAGAVGEIGLGTNINVSLPSDSGITFGKSKSGNVTFDDGTAAVAGSTMANVSSDGLNLTAIMGVVSGSTAANSIVKITFSNYSLNATPTAVNGTVNINVTLGNSSTSTYTIRNTSVNIILTKPAVYTTNGQFNAPLGANNVSGPSVPGGAEGPGYFNISVSYANNSVAGEIANGSMVNVTVPFDSGITFYLPGNVTCGPLGTITCSSMTNITNSGSTLYAVVGPASSSATAGFVNFTNFTLNISTTARNGTRFNVTTTPMNASGNVTSQILLGINTTNVSISFAGTNNTIFVDANGNSTASLPTLWINTTGGVAGEIGNFTNITIMLPTYTGVSFNTSNRSSTRLNTVGNITTISAFSNIAFNNSGLNSTTAFPDLAPDGTNLTVQTSINGSTATQATIMFYGYKLNVSSTAPAGRLNFTVQTTANGTGTLPFQSGPSNNTGTTLTQNFNWGSGITITPVWADAPITSPSSSTSTMAAGSTGTFYFNITNVSNAMNFTGATVTFAVNNSAASLSTASATSSSPSGNVSVNVTAPPTLGGFNLTVNVTGPAGFRNTTNSSINVTIQVTANTYASRLRILSDVTRLAPNGIANITVVAVDPNGNNVTFGNTNTMDRIQLATSTAGVTIDPSGPGASPGNGTIPMLAGPFTPGTTQASSVAYFNVTKTSSGSVSLTATDKTNTTVVFDTNTTNFAVDPVSISATSASASVVSNGSVVNLSVSVLDSSGSLISLSAQSINITTSNITLGGINNYSATSTFAVVLTNTSGIAAANFTANINGATGTVFANASYTNASGYILRSNVSISVTTGTPSNTTSFLNLTTTGSIAAGSNASFSATIKDSTNNLIPSQAVTFSTTTGGTLSNGTASGSSVIATTNSTGVAVVTLTTNTTVGVNTVTATTSTGNFNQSVSLTTVAGHASILSFTSATPASIGVSLNGTLEVQLQDSNGNNNATSGVTVNFATSNSAAGTLSNSSNTTNAAGRTSVVLTGSSTGGTTVITATSTGLTNATKTITVQPVSQIVLTASKSVAAANGNDTISITAQLADASGAPLNISGTTVTYNKSGVGNLSVSQGTTNSTGANVTAITSGTGGSAIVTASASGVPSASVTVTFSGNATAIIVTASPSSATVNNTIAVRAQAVDSAGNNAVIFNGAPITGFSVTFSPSSTAVTVSNASTAFNTTGGASANVTSATAATYTVTVGSGTGLSNSTSVTFSAAAVPVLTTINVTPSTATVASGSPQNFTAVGKDQNGNNITISPAAVWSSSNATVGTINSSTGVFTASKVGTATITATNGTNGTVSGNATVTVTAGSLAAITVSPSAPTLLVGATQTFTAAGADAAGNAVSITPAWSSSNTTVGTIDSTTGVFTAAAAGTTLVNATAQSITGSATVTVVTVIVNGAIAGTVTNASSGLPIQGATVTAANATFSTSTATNATGYYTITNLYPGTYTVTATATGYNSSSASVTVTSGATATHNFALTPSPALALTITASRANLTGAVVPTTNITTNLSTSVTFTVTDGTTSPVSGAAVTVTQGGSTLGANTTNAAGQATINVTAPTNATVTATASKAGYTDGTKVLAAKGDVSGDGKVDITDALFIAQSTVGLRTVDQVVGDVSGDGKVDITDALFIAQYTVSLKADPTTP